MKKALSSHYTWIVLPSSLVAGVSVFLPWLTLRTTLLSYQFAEDYSLSDIRTFFHYLYNFSQQLGLSSDTVKSLSFLSLLLWLIGWCIAALQIATFILTIIKHHFSSVVQLISGCVTAFTALIFIIAVLNFNSNISGMIGTDLLSISPSFSVFLALPLGCIEIILFFLQPSSFHIPASFIARTCIVVLAAIWCFILFTGHATLIGNIVFSLAFAQYFLVYFLLKQTT